MTDSGISLDLRLLFTGFYKVDAWWDFRNLTSSFYRLYYISKGECEIKLEDELFHLHEGDLFLIPKLVRASYHCDAPMEQYYICLLDGEKGSCAIADPTKLKKCLPSSGLDAMLFKRLADISPEYALWSVYPEEYDNKKELLVPGQSDTLSPVSLERKGIITQLFSRFLTPESLFNYSKSNSSHVRISYIIKYINDNLSARLSVSDLADILCLSPDYFTRLFEWIMGTSPKDYILMKKLEKAKDLLKDSSLSIREAGERIGISDAATFSCFFKDRTGVSPSDYRRSSDAG